MRQLKHHEKQLLRKVNLYSWKGDSNIRVAKILRTYYIQVRKAIVISLLYSSLAPLLTSCHYHHIEP